MDRKLRFKQILEALDQDLYERTLELKLAFISIIAGESIFLLGPPGVAKSLISRRIKQIFKNGKSFEYLMNRFSTPEEIFGPVSISKLKSDDKYERIVENYLPDADIVFLDEIWKASPSIQNSLLTVLNEKIYRNGDRVLKLPMKGLISASNELPEAGVGLEALWDRFIIRCFVHNIQDKDNFINFLKNQNITENISLDPNLTISNDEFKQFQADIKKVKITDEVINFIVTLKEFINEYNAKEENTSKIYVSDRRWKKIVKLVQTAAFINGRNKTQIDDCGIIKYTIWDELSHIEVIEDLTKKIFKLHTYNDLLNIDDITINISKIQNNLEALKNIKVKTVTIDNNTYYMLRNTFKLTLRNSYNNHANLIKDSELDRKMREFLSGRAATPPRSSSVVNKIHLYCNRGGGNLVEINTIGELNIATSPKNSGFALAQINQNYQANIVDELGKSILVGEFQLDTSNLDKEFDGKGVAEIKKETTDLMHTVDQLIADARQQIRDYGSVDGGNILMFDQTLEKEAQANLYQNEIKIDELAQQVHQLKATLGISGNGL